MDEILDESAISVEKNSVKDNESRAKNAMILLGIAIAVEVLSLYFINSQSNLLTDATNGILPSQAEAESNDTNLGLIGMISIVVNIVCAVYFIMWMRRAYANINRSGMNTESDDSVAAWSWFVPIYSLYKPVSIVSEIWKKTQLIIRNMDASFTSNMSLSLIGAWWSTWIFSSILSTYASFTSRSAAEAYDIEGMLNATNLSLYATMISIASGVFAILVVKKISEFETVLKKQ